MFNISLIMITCCMKYQSDYILMRTKCRNSINNVEAYGTFSSIGSDHCIIVCERI